MLVLVTNRDDVTADWLVAELRERGIAFARFNSEDYPSRVQLHWTPDDARLELGDTIIERRDVAAVWWRRPVVSSMSAGRNQAEADWASDEARAAVEGFWLSVDAHWVNHPDANDRAASKLEQLRRAGRFGFEVPATLVTNGAEAVRAFAAAHEQIVCKAIKSARPPAADGSADGMLYTAIVDDAVLGDLDEFGPEPYLFQALVPKCHDLRVIVIGERAFGCRILSQDDPAGVVDWRRAETGALVHEAEELEPDIAAACIAMTHSYGLRFAAIDLARRLDGGLTFFELNPNGQWAWIEQLTGLPLANALSDELIVAA